MRRRAPRFLSARSTNRWPSGWRHHLEIGPHCFSGTSWFLDVASRLPTSHGRV